MFLTLFTGNGERDFCCLCIDDSAKTKETLRLCGILEIVDIVSGLSLFMGKLTPRY